MASAICVVGTCAVERCDHGSAMRGPGGAFKGAWALRPYRAAMLGQARVDRLAEF